MKKTKQKKKLWNMKAMIIPVIIGALVTVTKELIKGLDNLEIKRQSGHHQNYRSEYWEESWRLEETCCHSDSCERPSANADEKNSQSAIIISEGDTNFYWLSWYSKLMWLLLQSLAKELKKLRTLKMKLVPLVIDEIGTATRDW